MNTPRTDAIMILFRKAFNAPNITQGLKYMGEAHDAVEQLEKDLIKAIKEQPNVTLSVK